MIHLNHAMRLPQSRKFKKLALREPGYRATSSIANEIMEN